MKSRKSYKSPQIETITIINLHFWEQKIILEKYLIEIIQKKKSSATKIELPIRTLQFLSLLFQIF